MTNKTTEHPAFTDLTLIPPVLKALDIAGYESPTPIQAQTIPHLMAGKDVLGQAQTGTGKTAAFALPILSRIDIKKVQPQVLVLAPTRELAIQVAEAFQQYASKLKGFHVMPIYGGQEYGGQIRQLKRGVHVVVGTPGRVMDHMRKGTLKLGTLKTLVLDEADEMLRMGFIDDVEWVLEQIPQQRQIALFSATMPTAIRRIAEKYLNDPEQITIKVKTTTAETIRQRFWMVSGVHKLDALTRILEGEPFEAIIIFVRTKTATLELAEKLEARGYAASALNGDIAQNQRERTVNRLKKGQLDILVATDVAARGLDVERVSHVINYDIPHDTEGYVHRIGRTGRAGRSGEAILFVSPREKRLLRAIEKATNKRIEPMVLPSTEIINDQRIAKFYQRITDTLAAENLEFYTNLLEQYQQEHDIPAMEIAAALVKMVQGGKPLLIKHQPEKRKAEGDKHQDRSTPPKRKGGSKLPDQLHRFRIEVGRNHDIKPGNIVGAIANEGNLDSKQIGQIEIYDDFSYVDLPADLSNATLNALKKAWVAGQQLNLSITDFKATALGGSKKKGKTQKRRGRK
jgi:ATP-dependent RNA helicase DeaD